MAGKAVFIVAAKRTPFGTFGGKLKGMTATDMCKVAATAALAAGKVSPEAVDSVVIGNVAQVSVCIYDKRVSSSAIFSRIIAASHFKT